MEQYILGGRLAGIISLVIKIVRMMMISVIMIITYIFFSVFKRNISRFDSKWSTEMFCYKMSDSWKREQTIHSHS